MATLSLPISLLRVPTRPSYGIWADKFGLVSNAESFNATVNGYETSLNHHFMSDYSGFFISHIAGLQVNPYKDNPAYIRINPSFIPALDNASAFYETVAGKVSVSWVRKSEEIELTVEKADGVGGEVVLPNGYIFTKQFRQTPIRNGGQTHFTARRCRVYPFVKSVKP